MLKSATALDKSRFYIWFWQKNSGQTGQPALAPQQKKTIIMDENVVTAKSLYAMVHFLFEIQNMLTANSWNEISVW